MQLHSDSIDTTRGAPLRGATVTVRLDGVLATIYDADGAEQDNPLTTDSTGSFSFRAANGEYTLTIEKVGITTKTQTVQLYDPADDPASADNLASDDDGKGAGLVGFLYSAAYAAGTLGKWLQNLATSAGAGLIGFVQSGAGAVTRTVQDKLRDIDSIKDVGALADGSTDDSAAVQTALTSGVSFIPRKTVKTDTAMTGSYRWVSFGGDFSGAHPLDENYPAFGPGAMRAAAVGANNSIIGIAHNNKVAGTLAFPTGVTGYARFDNAGNTAFGLFGRSDLYAAGVATNELNSFNMAAAPSSALPPNRNIGTTERHPIALTVAAGGDYASSIGIHICKEGGEPQKFLTGLYMSPDALSTYGMVIDANSGSTQSLAALLKHKTGFGALQMQGVGTPSASNSFMLYVDGNGVTKFSVKEDGGMSVAGNVSLGGSPNTDATLRLAANITGGATAWGVRASGVVQPDVTTTARLFNTSLATAASAFTLTNAQHFRAEQGTIGAGSAVTDQRAFYATSSLTGAASNYGFYGEIAAGSGRWNLYMGGTAQNYLAGVTGIGTAASDSTQLALPPSSTTKSSLRITQGTAPSAPVDGDMWTTSAGLFIRIGGVTKTVTLT